jgi:monoamine oxidase
MGGRKHHCIIIGAGLSGLAAAHRLTKKGWTVDVLEARDRTGGRVLSHRFRQAPGLVCELGGEWIGKDHKAMQRLCRRFKLDLQDHSYSFKIWSPTQHDKSKMYRPGEWGFLPKLEVIFNKFRDEYRSYTRNQLRELDMYDWWSALRDRGFPEEDLLNRDLMDSTDFGESIRHTSAYSAATEYFDGNSTNEMDLKIVGGNDRLISALVTSLPERSLHKNSHVEKIRQRRSKVEVFVAGQTKPFVGDACICTVPLRSLTNIMWDPPLPAIQNAAARQLQYCRITKTLVLYPERFWPKPKVGGFSMFTGAISDFCFDSSYLQPGRQGILCSYAIGDKADDVAAEPKDRLKRWITQDVIAATSSKHVSDSVIARYLKGAEIAQYTWQGDSYTSGAYAFYRPGQWFTLRDVLRKPHGRVHFAGEHLAQAQGFMEGAVKTGEAAAGHL